MKPLSQSGQSGEQAWDNGNPGNPGNPGEITGKTPSGTKRVTLTFRAIIHPRARTSAITGSLIAANATPPPIRTIIGHCCPIHIPGLRDSGKIMRSFQQDDTFLYTTCAHCFALYASPSLVFRARHWSMYVHTDDIIVSTYTFLHSHLSSTEAIRHTPTGRCANGYLLAIPIW
jgi:hypothetical protein